MKNKTLVKFLPFFLCLSFYTATASFGEAEPQNSTKDSSESSITNEIDNLKKQISKLEKKVENNEEHTLSPAFSGFFDINVGDLETRKNPWAIGPVELDLEWTYGENLGAAGALVFADGVADVGVAFIDYHLYDHNIPARGRIFFNTGFHIQVGRFDVPFGLDYSFFATPDRETITPPLVTDYIMDGGWGDDGVRIYGVYKFIDYTLYTTNGFNDGMAVGGRLGISPFMDPFRLHRDSPGKLLSIGVSWAIDFTKNLSTNDQEEELIGYDAQINLGNLSLRGEYVNRRKNLDNVSLSGYYVTIRYTISSFPVYVIADYSESEQTGAEKIRQTTYGATYEVNENAILKFEYLNLLDSDTSGLDGLAGNEVYTAKIVLSFE